jgi:putative endonuclease
MLTERQQLGLKGEEIAARWLESKGWTVLDRRFRAGHRDLDIVAARPDEGQRIVAFVEVRTRLSTEFGLPSETVGWKKQQELGRAARAWLASNRRSGDVYRFDVIGVVLDGSNARIQHLPDAFWL